MRAACLAGFLLLAAPALAQGEGAALAQRWCAACHADGARRAADSAPSIPEIAARYAGAPERLNAFLQGAHGPMPNFNLSRAEAEALTAWLLAQAPR
ncbi:MAG: c-type cytochrome [Acetobacteraceae bacterium]